MNPLLRKDGHAKRRSNRPLLPWSNWPTPVSLVGLRRICFSGRRPFWHRVYATPFAIWWAFPKSPTSSTMAAGRSGSMSRLRWVLSSLQACWRPWQVLPYMEAPMLLFFGGNSEQKKKMRVKNVETNFLFACETALFWYSSRDLNCMLSWARDHVAPNHPSFSPIRIISVSRANSTSANTSPQLTIYHRHPTGRSGVLWNPWFSTLSASADSYHQHYQSSKQNNSPSISYNLVWPTPMRLQECYTVNSMTRGTCLP